MEITGVPHELSKADPRNPLVSLCDKRLDHHPNGRKRLDNMDLSEATLILPFCNVR